MDREVIKSLSSNISQAKGLLAILLSKQKLDLIVNCPTAQQHTLILLQDLMEEIYTMEKTLTQLITQIHTYSKPYLVWDSTKEK